MRFVQQKAKMKANVLIYTQTNRSFIQEKVYDQFKYQCLKDDELKDLDVDKMIRVIKQIYDFGQGNQEMKIFNQRLPDNINKFIVQQYRNTNQTDDLVIDINKLIDIIYACIQDGFDNKNSQETKQKPKEQPKQQPKQQYIQQEIQQQDEPKQTEIKVKKKEKVQQKVQTQPQKVRKFYVPKPKTPEKKNFIQKFDMPETKMPARYLMHLAKRVKKQEQKYETLPDVKPLDLNFIEKNKQNLQTRLEDLFRHYCAQQQNVGQHTTFDRIKQQCSQMTVGKFLLFCKIVKIFDDKELNKQFFVSKYKRIAEGKKEIQFDKFKELLNLVDEEYIKIKRKSLGQEAVIPTYEARLRLQGNQYKKMKKDVDLPFYTKQKQGRQLKKYATIDDSRYPKKDELTGHSGKFGKDLKQQIERKLVSQSVTQKAKKRSEKEIKTPRPKIIKLEQMRNQVFPEMQWVMEQDQSDKTFMRQYRNRDIVGQVRRRVTDLQKMERNKLS